MEDPTKTIPPSPTPPPPARIALSRRESSRNVLEAVETLKANGLSGIGQVVIPATNPEYLDAASDNLGLNTTFRDDKKKKRDDHDDSNRSSSGSSSSSSSSGDSYLVATALTNIDEDDLMISKSKGRKNSTHTASSRDMTYFSINIFPESISHLGSVGNDMATVSIASEDIETMGGDDDDNDNDNDNDDDNDDATAASAKSKQGTIVSALPLEATLTVKADAITSGFSIEASTDHCAKGKDLWSEGCLHEALTEFRKAILGLESILGTNHLLVSKMYFWMGQIFLRLLEDDEHEHEHETDASKSKDQEHQQPHQPPTKEARKRAWADAAVEALSWSLKIRYTQPETDAEEDQEKPVDEIAVAIEASLAQAWKYQAEEWHLSPSSRTQTSNKSLDHLKDSIKIEHKADLALFRMERNQLSQAIDVYDSLVNQYNKSISAFADDGAFSAMCKMAFWYHKLGRLRATMDAKTNKEEEDGESQPSFHSINSMPLDGTEHNNAAATQGSQNPAKAAKKKTISQTYLEHAAFWYRMALEVFCTSIGRFDKTRDRQNPTLGSNIDITEHPTYRQLLKRLGRVLVDHNRAKHKQKSRNKEEEAKNSEKYLQPPGVWDSALHHFGAKQASKDYQRLNRNKSDSLSRLKALRECLAKAQEAYTASMAIEEVTWGSDHQIVIRIRSELGRATRLKNALDLEITGFPAKLAAKQQREREEEERKRKEQEKQQKEQREREELEQRKQRELQKLQEIEKLTELPPPSRPKSRSRTRTNSRAASRRSTSKGSNSLQRLKDQIPPTATENRSREEHKSQTDKDLLDKEIVASPEQPQVKKVAKKQKPRSPSGSIASDRLPINGIETLRRLQDQVYESKIRMEEHTAERDELLDQLQSKTAETQQALAVALQNEEESSRWKENCENVQSEKELLQTTIQELENQIAHGEQKQGQLEFTMKKEGAETLQSSTQKEVELEYWKQRFETAQAEWTETQSSLEAELQKARTNARSRGEELLELSEKVSGLDGDWKIRKDEVKRLREANQRLQRAVATGVAERKQLEFSKQMSDLEFAETKEQQVLDAMTKAAKSDSEATSWKRKYEVSQKEWQTIHDRLDQQARDSIADATLQASELARWKKKFEIAQREWLECQTEAERQAQGAIGTAKRYKASHSELAGKFTAAQQALKQLLEKNKLLQKQVIDSQSKQDQLEFSLKKQTIDHAKFQDALNRKTAEAQIWKDQCQASQQAQKQIAHEMQLTRATDGSLQERIVDLRQQNTELKERNNKLQSNHDRKSIELEAKNKEVTLIKQAALQRIKQLKKGQKQQTINSAMKEAALVERDANIDLSDPKNLAAKLGRTQRALEYVEKDYKESVDEKEALAKAKKEMEGNIADAQKIISLLKTANHERIEQCSKLQSEKDEVERQLNNKLNESHEYKTQIERNADLQKELDGAIADKEYLAAQVMSQEPRPDGSHSQRDTQELNELKEKLEALSAREKSLTFYNEYLAAQVMSQEPGPDGSHSQRDTQELIELKEKLEDLSAREKAFIFYAEQGVNLVTMKLDKSIVENNALTTRIEALTKSQVGDSCAEENTQDLFKRISDLESDLQKSEIEKKDLRSDVKKYKLEAYSPSRRSFRSDMESPEMNDQIKTLSDRCEELERELVISKHQVEDLQDRLRDRRGTSGKQEYRDMVLAQVSEEPSQSATEDHDEVVTNTDTNKIKTLQKRCEELERDVVIANHQIEDLQDEIRENKQRGEGGLGDGKEIYHDMILAQGLERKLEETDEIRKSLTSELEDYEEKVHLAEEKEKDFRRKLDTSNKEIRKLRNSVRDFTKLSMSQHGGSQQSLNPKVDIQLEVIEDLEKELDESKKIRKELSSKLKACEEKIARTEQKEKEFQWLSEEYKQLEDKLEESNQIREELSTKVKSLKERLERSEKNEKKDNETDILERKLSILRQKLDESANENKRLQSQIDNLTSTSTGTEEEQRQHFADKISKLEIELNDSTKGSKTLKKKLETVSEDLEDLEEENEELTEKYKKLEQQYQITKRQSEQNNKTLSSKLQTGNKEHDLIRKEYSKLEKNFQETSKRNMELESNIDEMKKKNLDILNLENSLENTTKQNKELKSKIDEMKKQNLDSLKLEQDLLKTSRRNKELESRVDEMRKRNIENLKLERDYEELVDRNQVLESRMEEIRNRNVSELSDHSRTSCKACLALGDELRTTIEQSEKHFEATEKFQDDHDKLLNRYNFLEKELKEAIDQNEILEAQLKEQQETSPQRDERLDADDTYQELNIRCIELEEELSNSKDRNDKKLAQIAALKTKVADLEAYADDTASDLEQAESIIGALKAGGAGGSAEVTMLLDRCNKLQRQLKEAQKKNETITNSLDNSQKESMKMMEELSESMDNLVVNINLDSEQKAESALEKAVKELNTKVATISNEKDELEAQLKKTIEDCEQQKRVNGHVEKDRNYLDKMYNECKKDMAKVQSDLEDTKELLKISNNEKEEFERQLQVEKHVLAMKNQENENSEENELEELYRQARDELAEVEGMLFETEENLETLKTKYQKLQEDSKLPSGADRAESESESEIQHDLQDLSRDELLVETKKALRKMQDTQTKVIDLQETNMILQAQLKSSLTFKEKSNTPRRRNNGGGGGFWSLGGGSNDAIKKNNINTKNNETGSESNIDAPNENSNNNNNNNGIPRGRFFGWRGGARGGDASIEKGGDDNASK